MELSKRLDQLTNQMSGAINNITKHHGRSLSPGRRRRCCSSISRDEDSTHPLCWYHQKFGDNAKKCHATALPKIGKRLGQSLSATSATGCLPSRLLFLTDRNSRRRFLIDTGAEVSVIPPSNADRRNKHDCLALRAVNGSSIATYGTRSLTLDLGLHRTFRWIFVIADIHTPIIGTDFL